MLGSHRHLDVQALLVAHRVTSASSFCRHTPPAQACVAVAHVQDLVQGAPAPQKGRAVSCLPRRSRAMALQGPAKGERWIGDLEANSCVIGCRGR